jgi:hypothetical protein
MNCRLFSADVPLKTEKKYQKNKTSNACEIEYITPKTVSRSDEGIPTTTVITHCTYRSHRAIKKSDCSDMS